MRRWIIILSLMLIPAVSSAYTANDVVRTVTSDGSHGDTTNAIAYVSAKAADGWTVIVGSAGGSYTWAYPVTINIPHIFTIRGASSSSRPTITSTTTILGYGISITATALKTVTVKDFIFSEWSAANSLFIINGSGLDCFRLTNLKFNHNSGNGAVAWISDLSNRSGVGPYGLIDHCEISSSGQSGYGFYVRENTLSGSWGNPMTWGSRSAVYIEDCVFTAATAVTGSPCLDSNNGGRIVFRHNALTNFCCGSHGAEPQTGDAVSQTNSVLQVEMMHNTFAVSAGQGIAWTMLMRGGTCAYFSNTIVSAGDGFYNTALELDYYRSIPDNGVCLTDRTYPDDYLGTQQPGCGSVASAGQDPKFLSSKWGSVPVYYWSNNVTATMYMSKVHTDGSAFIQTNRDYFGATPKPGYTEYTYPHPLAGVSYSGGTYITTFAGTENPIDESGMWTNGGTTGLDWTDVRKTPGFCFGTQTGSGSYDDSVACLTGNWGSNQTTRATVKIASQDDAGFKEVELLLRWKISAHVSRGYECNYGVVPGAGYMQIVRWNGANGDWTLLDARNVWDITDGMVVSASVSGNRITTYTNGVEVFHADDTTWSNGTPGLGFYIATPNTTGSITHYGFSDYMATDGQGTAASITVQPQNQAVQVGQNASFSVTATGDPTITYQWKLGGANIANATASAYATNGVALAANGNSYTVGVSNSVGGELSSAATLTVTNAPAATVTLRANTMRILGTVGTR